MSKYPKELLLYRRFNSVLNETDLIKNIISLKKYFIDENYSKGKYVGIGQSKYGNNFYTSQSIELFREIIIFSGISKSKSISENIVLTNFINSYREFKGILEKKELKKYSNAKRQLIFPLSHKQFWYQKIELNLLDTLNYYYNYYSNNDLDNYIKSKFGTSYKNLFIAIFLLYEMALSFDYLDLLNTNNIYKKEIDIIIKSFSLDLANLKDKLKTSYSSANKFELKELENYGLDTIFNSPLLKIGNNFTVPIPTLLLNRITNFIYYDFDEEFKKNVLGVKNQEFIFSILSNNIDNSKYKIYYTNNYLRNYQEHNTPPNPDIIIEGQTHILFIECKTNSISFDSSINGLTNNDFNSKFKKNFTQVYKSINFYINKLKNGENYFGIEKSDKKIIPLILYIKNPYLGFGDYTESIIEEIKVEGKIPDEIISNYNPLILDNIGLINFINVINEIGLDTFLAEIGKDYYFGWEIEGIINNILSKNKIKNSFKFENDFLDILENEIDKLQN